MILFHKLVIIAVCGFIPAFSGVLKDRNLELLEEMEGKILFSKRFKNVKSALNVVHDILLSPEDH